MRGRIVVMRQEDYASWLTRQPEGDDLAHVGAKLFVAQGCSGCHAENSSVHAPKLDRALWADRPALGRPSGKGGRPLHPRFRYCSRSATSSPVTSRSCRALPGLLDDGEIQSLTAYVRSLGSEKAGAETEKQDD